MKIKVTGLDKAERRLKELSRAARELDGTHNVPLGDLFTPWFMETFTNFASISDLFAAGGFNASSQEEFRAIDQAALDSHVSQSTDFDSWQEMLQRAGTEYAKRKLGF